MKLLGTFRLVNKSLRLQLFSAFLTLLILLLTSCTRISRHYSILDFKGEGAVINLSRSYLTTQYESDSVSSTAILADKGDLIMYGEFGFFYYRDTSQTNFVFKTIKKHAYLNEEINSINISGKDDSLTWVNQMNSTDISSLGFIYFNSAIPESYIPYLTDLAKIKPDIGLGYDGDLMDLSGLFEVFNPGFIIGGTVSQNEFNLLSGLTNLELLMVSLKDSVYSTPFPAMPGLKQLILTDDNKKSILYNDLLINNKQIERLLISKSGKLDLSIIKPLNNLKELVISNFDNIENTDLIKSYKQLEVLSVTGRKFRFDRDLKGLIGIKWITFPSDVTQAEFSSFTENHADLEVVEIIKNDKITSLQPLLKLRKLDGLTISDTLTDLSTIKSLKNLKYLSLPESVLEDSTKNAELKSLLPYTRIVANQGFCLGSGWLLLIIPFILLFRLFLQQKSHKVHHGINALL